MSEKKESTTDRVLKALPGIGAVIGGVVAHKNPRALGVEVEGASRLLPTALGAGAGAGIGWIPTTLKDTVSAASGAEKVGFVNSERRGRETVQYMWDELEAIARGLDKTAESAWTYGIQAKKRDGTQQPNLAALSGTGSAAAAGIGMAIPAAFAVGASPATLLTPGGRDAAVDALGTDVSLLSKAVDAQNLKADSEAIEAMTKKERTAWLLSNFKKDHPTAAWLASHLPGVDMPTADEAAKLGKAPVEAYTNLVKRVVASPEAKEVFGRRVGAALSPVNLLTAGLAAGGLMAAKNVGSYHLSKTVTRVPDHEKRASNAFAAPMVEGQPMDAGQAMPVQPQPPQEMASPDMQATAPPAVEKEAAPPVGDIDPVGDQRDDPIAQVLGTEVERIDEKRARGYPIIAAPPGYIFNPELAAFVPDTSQPGWMPQDAAGVAQQNQGWYQQGQQDQVQGAAQQEADMQVDQQAQMQAQQAHAEQQKAMSQDIGLQERDMKLRKKMEKLQPPPGIAGAQAGPVPQ